MPRSTWRLEARCLVISLVGRLPGFAVDLLVIGHLQPGGQHAVQFVQGEDLAGADFRFQLPLQRFERSVRSGRRREGRAVADAAA